MKYFTRLFIHRPLQVLVLLDHTWDLQGGWLAEVTADLEWIEPYMYGKSDQPRTLNCWLDLIRNDATRFLCSLMTSWK